MIEDLRQYPVYALIVALVNEKWHSAAHWPEFVGINLCAKFYQSIRYGSRVMSIFTNWLWTDELTRKSSAESRPWLIRRLFYGSCNMSVRMAIIYDKK